MLKSKLIRLVLGIVVFIGLISNAYAESFIVRNIQITGNQRIGKQTISSYLPVKVGERFDSSQTVNVIAALYDTGFFSNVEVDSRDSTLFIKVEERSVITTLNVSGNKKITKKQLLDVFKQVGVSQGEVLDRSALNGLEQALVREYYNMGYYNVKVQTKVIPKGPGRVTVDIKINEGPGAKIKEIHIIGNQAFKEKTLLKNFSLTPSAWWKGTFLTHTDQYSKEKLDADLEKLRSYYMDRGYLKFNIDNSQVSLTPDKKHIYILIHVNEGPVYHVSGYSLEGNLLGKRAEMERLIAVKKGEVFSRKDVMDSNAKLEEFVGDYGYAVPSIDAKPVVDETHHQVFIHFTVNPNRRVYVRRITFTGNNKTDETVLRRELRQQEGAMFSLSKVNESKRRLANLGYLENVDVKAEKVPGNPDEIDLLYKVKEASSASANFNLGYSQADGFIYGASINEQNFMGTGRGVALQFNNSKYYQTYNFTYLNPYYTVNNVSLKLDAYAQVQDPGRVGLGSYTTNMYGASATYGIPLSDYSRLNAGYGYEFINITDINKNTPESAFEQKFGHKFHEAKFTGGWSYSHLDRAIFPTQGFANILSLEFDAPVATRALTFYKTDDSLAWYYPLSQSFIFHARGEVGYGDGFGQLRSIDPTTGERYGLPFFRHYYAGGMDTVRGFNAYSLGPRFCQTTGSGKNTHEDCHALGGDFLTDASVGLIFPNPLGDHMRTTAFVDVGNVYNNIGDFNAKELRSGAGVEVEWRSPLGLLRFSFAKAICSKKKDDERFFDFSMGTSF